MTQGGAAEDLALVRGSYRAKFVALSVVAAVAVAIAGWYLLRPSYGERERIDHVLVVPAGKIRYGPYLGGWGFSARDLSFETVFAELGGASADPVAAALRLADRDGFGYVAFEYPARLDFGGVELAEAPSFAPDCRFAVVSVGDLARPHRVSVASEPASPRRGPEHQLLQALFVHEPLAALRPKDFARPGPQVALRDTLKNGLLMIDALEADAAEIAGIEARARARLVDDEKGAPPILLSTVHEDVQAIALPTGELLLRVRAADMFGRMSEPVALADESRWMFVPQGADPIAAREPCPSLTGGSLDERTDALGVSPGADAFVVHRAGRSRLFKPVGPGCEFVDLGLVELPLREGEAIGSPHASGQIARAHRQRGEGHVYTVKPGDVAPNELVRLESHLGAPMWLDARSLAVSESPADGEGRDGILFLAVDLPDRALRLDARHLGGAEGIHDMAPAPDGPDGPQFVVVVRSPRGTSLYRVALPGAPAELLAAAVAGVDLQRQPRAVRDGQRSLVVTVEPAGWTIAAVYTGMDIARPRVSPDAQWVAFETDDAMTARHEVGVLSLADGSLRMLTRNDLDDRKPHFAADSRTVIVDTNHRIERTKWDLHAARGFVVVDVPRDR